MLEGGCGVGVIVVEVDGFKRAVGVVFPQIFYGNLPGAVGFLSLVPPFGAIGELFELDGLGFGVVLPAFGEQLLVVPDFLGRMGAVEDHEIRRDARARGEDAVGKADDGVEVEVLHQLFFDPGADTVAEEGAVGRDDGGAATGNNALSQREREKGSQRESKKGNQRGRETRVV